MFGFKIMKEIMVIPTKKDDAKDFTEGLTCVCNPDNGKFS